jgi:protein-disulfide isomerase-like protein with CxxC motif
LRQIDNRTIQIETSDRRIVDFRRTIQTKFYREGKEIKESELKLGDSVAVEGTRDQNGIQCTQSFSLQPAKETA